MQNYSTIIGVIEMRKKQCTTRDCQYRFKIGSGTVAHILQRYKELDLTLDELRAISPNKVEEAFYPPDRTRKEETPLPDYEKAYERKNEKGSKANLFFLWKEYKQEFPNGYQYTQYVEHYNRYVKEHYGTLDVAMAVERVPGEKMYIDWVGDQPEIICNRETGEMCKAHVFVTTIGISSKIYAEIFPDEKQSSFVKGTVHAVEAYGAVAKYFVPDNCRTAVTKHTKDELIINSSYQDLEKFYDVVILPPPARKPTGKPTVERYVQYLETELLEKMKEKIYSSFEEANQEVKEIVAEINNEVPNGWNITHQEAFENYDRPRMKSLSDGSFSLCEYVAFSAVPRNYHLLYDGHYYSVFYTYYGKPVILKATMTEIMISDENNKLICTHQRSYAKFPRYITKDEHMTSEHRFYKEINEHDGDYYRRWAASIGDNMSTMIDTVLKASEHEEQSYNSCNGILHMCDRQSRILCDEAARRCVELHTCRYTYFKKVLAEVINTGGKQEDTLPDHDNIWGKDYYK